MVHGDADLVAEKASGAVAATEVSARVGQTLPAAQRPLGAARWVLGSQRLTHGAPQRDIRRSRHNLARRERAAIGGNRRVPQWAIGLGAKQGRRALVGERSAVVQARNQGERAWIDMAVKHGSKHAAVRIDGNASRRAGATPPQGL